MNKAEFVFRKLEMGCCECGCGQTTKIATQTCLRDNILKGQHRRFISGHQNRRFIKNHSDRPAEGQFKHKGYVYVLCPDHPYKTQNRYVKRCRLVVEKHIGRYLTHSEHIHHVNLRRDDDRAENLIILSLVEHMKLHKQLKKSIVAPLS